MTAAAPNTKKPPEGQAELAAATLPRMKRFNRSMQDATTRRSGSVLMAAVSGIDPAVAGFNAESAEGLEFHRIMKSSPRGLHRDAQRDAQQAGDDLYIMTHIADQMGLGEQWRAHPVFAQYQRRIAKALDSSTANAGSEFVPTRLSPQIYEQIQLESALLAKIPLHEIDGLKEDVPRDNGTGKAKRANPREVGDNMFDNANKVARSTIATAKFDFDLRRGHLAEGHVYSKQLEMGSLPDVAQFIRSRVPKRNARAIEDGILTGVAFGGTHIDNDHETAGDNTDSVWLYDGLRKMALAAAKIANGGGNPPYDNFVRLKAKGLGKYGARTRNVCVVASVIGEGHLLRMGQFQTADKLQNGPGSAESGVVGRICGMDVVLSEFLRDDLDLTGVNSATPANNVYTQYIAFRTDAFLRAVHPEGLLIFPQFDPGTAQTVLWTHEFGDFKPTHDVTTEPVIALLNGVSNDIVIP